MTSVRSLGNLALAFARYLMTVAIGARRYVATGETPADGYRAMRWLYAHTNGRFNDLVSAGLSLRHPPRRSDGSRCGDSLIPPSEADSVVRALRTHGYVVLNRRLPEECCDALAAAARRLPALPVLDDDPSGSGSEKLAQVDLGTAGRIAPRFNFDESDLIELPEVQRLMMDRGLLQVARSYLRVEPRLDFVTMWWNVPFGDHRPSANAAQLFHWDMDRIRFLKTFVYLTDVDAQSGPHVFVRGSTVRKPRPLLVDGRLSDEAVTAHYPSSDLCEIVGPRGTVFLADTRGIHKGTAPQARARLVLQFEHAVSLFGQSYPLPRADTKGSPELRAFARENRRVFEGRFGHLL